ncbi:MAG TPA: hypothetical protein VFL99_13430 [Segeticoccus sp.]|uniref:hypothetical protein n=1 Tax=Segeticoccus sp. TaxID=2706531 RepID=UPI002D7EF766|nr:hypothetical protein [Segeticoccus sp.]HET8601325.1 hypothetical protein [Segeticoccus sp.]
MPEQLDGGEAAAAEPAGGSGETLTSLRSGALVVVGALVTAGLVAASVYAGPGIAALVVAAGGAVLAWGWPGILDLPSPRGTSGVLLLAALAVAAAAFLTADAPLLRLVPAAVAGAVLLTFVHQLLRRDGRPRLVTTVAGTLTGIAALASGVGFVGLSRLPHGDGVAAVAVIGVAAGALLDHLLRGEALRAWLLPLELVVGAGLAVALSVAVAVPWGVALLLGVVCTGVSHALRRVVTALPALVAARPQLAAGVTTVLLDGVVAYLVCRALLP